MKYRLWHRGVLGISIISAFAILLAVNVAYVDIRWIDVNTGSQKGGRQWRFGFVTREWYSESGLEFFLKNERAFDFDQHWVSVAGDGRNIFGRIRSRSHGRPGAILALMPDWIDRYCQIASDDEKVELYSALRSQNVERILEMVEKITDTVTLHVSQAAN
ncbi:MAG: hypothetical protein L7V86_11020 [Verrucomicrobiales bacterium]|nr:hypothetical protein [Verrucomicrobiales bacterium]